MVVVDFDAPDLKALAPRLEALMKSARSREERAPLDSLLGALHGLIQARRLGFKDRSHSLDDPRGRSPQGVEYWDYGPLVRVGLMAKGQLRVEGAWAAGFYFDSALARMAAVFDRVVKRTARRKGLLPASRTKNDPSLRDLLRALTLESFFTGKLGDVYREMNRLKHEAVGHAERRRVTMADARTAFEQALALLEHPKMR
jgi:hypothetical protein